ncbi:NAD(P)-dependent alcohol dehydrogenase [Tychonema sp. LEGE 07203]|uniref:NAD(P)-dependent alcohol dehydrogenase n=1 Tax=Tychonema sp. LEGE 07203 TaxID=1828671 RepID=UPI0018809917|nr:NAD(P)-dependent alcohol dehydrogenase [Tychonema sp. LEGE 07203]MBE9095336.1 NAD(P)-dependent alcohol dehydrogenase [Tychonema sp. LEGE 07203]
MKAVVYDRYGSAEELQYRELEKPIAKSNELLIRVRASSVNPVDWKIRQGHLQLLTGFNFPRTVGSDISGVVAEVGREVTKFQPGDEVYTFLNPINGGACAEYAALPESSAEFKPKNITHAEAAAVPIAGLTALQALRDLGEIQAGKKVLINGASGGVGTFAVQIAKAMNAEVTGVCSAKNLDFVKGLGADIVLDYAEIDFTKQPEKYDIILDAVGTKTFAECEKVLQSEGVYISTLPSFDNFVPMLTSWFLSGKKAKFILANANPADLGFLRELIESEKVEPIVDRTYSLAEVAAAHTYSETGRAVGKIAIVIDS